MSALPELEPDSLSSLEERITRAVELVTELRRERDQLAAELRSVQTELEEARRQTSTSSLQAEKLARELDDLRSERKQVRTRIEKLLGQMDLLSNS